jgi:hypothetical protein
LVKQFDTTPNDTRGGIWQGGTGPAIDSSGNMYFSTGNGGFDQNSSSYTTDTDWGDSVLKLPTSGTFDITFSKTSATNWFTPNTYASLNTNDYDLGSSGSLLLPAQVTGGNFLVTGGKAGIMYVLNCANMGGENATKDNAAQEINLGGPSSPLACTPAYFNGYIYYATGYGPLSQRAVSSTVGNYIATTGNNSTDTYDQWGEGIFITANGTTNGLCWIVNPPTARLDVYNATNVSGNPIYSYAVSNCASPRFNISTVVNGKAYFTAYSTSNGALGQLVVMGLLNPNSGAPATDTPTIPEWTLLILGLTLVYLAHRGLRKLDLLNRPAIRAYLASRL